MVLGKGDEVWQACHVAIILHDLADHAGRVLLSGGARDVNDGLGVTGAHKRAAIAGDERENMAWRGDVLICTLRIDCRADGMCSVGSGNAGGHTLTRLDGNGKSGLVTAFIAAFHEFQAKCFGAFAPSGALNRSARAHILP